MIKAKVKFSVKRGGEWGSQEMQLELEDATFHAATSDVGRRKLDDWAKQLFPKADAARVIQAERVK